MQWRVVAGGWEGCRVGRGGHLLQHSGTGADSLKSQMRCRHQQPGKSGEKMYFVFSFYMFCFFIFEV